MDFGSLTRRFSSITGRPPHACPKGPAALRAPAAPWLSKCSHGADGAVWMPATSPIYQQSTRRGATFDLPVYSEVSLVRGTWFSDPGDLGFSIHKKPTELSTVLPSACYA